MCAGAFNCSKTTWSRHRSSCGVYAVETDADQAALDACAVTPQQVITRSDFLPGRLSQTLRKTFTKNFADSKGLRSERFCWDYWHVPGQYTQFRTPAQEYFAPKYFQALEGALLEFGKQHLGCIGITPIWLSYYIGEFRCPAPRCVVRSWQRTGMLSGTLYRGAMQ